MLQAEDVAQAHPRIVEAVETMLKKGKWTVPGTCFLSSTILPLHSTTAVRAHVVIFFAWFYRLQGEVRRPFTHVVGVILDVFAGVAVAG